MRSYILFFSLSISLGLLPLSAQNSEFQKKGEALRRAFGKVKSSPGDQDKCREFFRVFPNSFREFDSLYGYERRPSVLYNGYFSHVDSLFRNLHCVNDTLYFIKLINLGIGGHWEADGVGSLQDIIQERMLANPTLAFALLNRRTSKSITSFFYFFFQGIHAPYSEIPQEFTKLKLEYPRVYQNLVIGFQRGIRDSGHHNQN